MVGESPRQYVAEIPHITFVTNQYHWELFNGSASNVTLHLLSLRMHQSGDTLASATVTREMNLWRTTAISGGGTPQGSFESTSTLSANFARLDTSDAVLPSGVTITVLPTSITTGSFLLRVEPWQEEGSGGPDMVYEQLKYDVLRNLPGLLKPLTLRANQGLAVRQGNASGSGGSMGWTMHFLTTP